MSAQATRDRLAPQDLYRLLDWLRDEWDAVDEWYAAKRLQRLRRNFEHLPSRFWDRARPLIEELGRGRLSRDFPYQAKIRALSELVSEWERSRPPLLSCEVCGIEIRGHRSMFLHLATVHYFEDV